MLNTQERKPTSEQNDIINSIKLGIPKIEVGAFAGTGKTSSSEMVVDSMPLKYNFLYIVFNKTAELEAKERFKGRENVEVKTVNALAFANFPRERGEKIEIKNYKYDEVGRILNIGDKEARKAFQAFQNFCDSDEIMIDNKYAQDFWTMMELKKIQPTHSFILKTFHLNLETIGAKALPIGRTDIGTVIVDEYQDSNPVTLAIADKIPAKTYLKIGDKHQGIYGFRGALNVMGKDNEAMQLFLTKSFRFNQGIADRANAILQIYKGEKNTIEGVNPKNKIEDCRNGCLLSRTNAELIYGIQQLVKAKTFYKTIRDPSLLFDLPISIHQIERGNEPRNSKRYLLYKYENYQKERAKYSSFVAYLEDEAKKRKDPELKVAVKLVGKIPYDEMIMMEKQTIQNNSLPETPQYFLSTIHTAKGLEWDFVKVADDLYDYPKLIAQHIFRTYGDMGDVPDFDFVGQFREDVKEGKVQNNIIEEFNLLYVALTRASIYLKTSKNISMLEDESLTNEHVQKSYQHIVKESKKKENSNNLYNAITNSNNSYKL